MSLVMFHPGTITGMAIHCFESYRPQITGVKEAFKRQFVQPCGDPAGWRAVGEHVYL